MRNNVYVVYWPPQQVHEREIKGLPTEEEALAEMAEQESLRRDRAATKLQVQTVSSHSSLTLIVDISTRTQPTFELAP